jgi:GDP/UDP-N,N'-diacetylbacillosamine 2-epimerase (hydrolysing)
MEQMIKKICVFTGSRADYGIMTSLLKKMKKSKKIKLELIATGMHLEKKFGNTYKEIINDGFKIKKIRIPLKSDTKQSISNATANSIIKFSKILSKIKPDLVLILGDRFEAFGAAFASLSENIPIAHIHGGESTKALIDDAIRHSITKMASIHFTSHEVYKKRIINMGEDPKYVFNFGALGAENIKDFKFLEKKQLEKETKIKFKKKNIMVTFHPETLSDRKLQKKIPQFLKIMSKINDTCLILTLPNADAGNKFIYSTILNFSKQNNNIKCFKSLGKKLYFSTLKFCDLAVGNSSSGIIEVPSFNIPTIDIGDRQGGRVKGSSIIECSINTNEFKRKIKIAFSKNFRKKIKKKLNPYYQKNTAKNILKILISNKISKEMIKKDFYDVKR